MITACRWRVSWSGWCVVNDRAYTLAYREWEKTVECPSEWQLTGCGEFGHRHRWEEFGHRVITPVGTGPMFLYVSNPATETDGRVRWYAGCLRGGHWLGKGTQGFDTLAAAIAYAELSKGA